MPWAPLPFAGGSYADDARPWSHQDTVNYIPVIAEKAGTRSRMMLRGVPGMRTFAQVGEGPIRGARDVEGKCFIVSGSTLYQMSPLGIATAKGTIPGTGLVSMTHNQIAGGNELVIANGSSGYVYNTKTGALTQITDEAFPGFVQVDYLNQYVIGVEPQRRFWLHSDLADATSYNSIDRYEGEVSPDRIVGIVSTHGQALVLSERSGEFFDNIVTDTAAFQRSQGTAMEKGCISAQTIAKIDNSVLFVGHDGVVYRVDGYTPVRVSTHAIEQALSRCDLTKAFAFVFEDRGHAVYYLTCPDGHTWGFDVSTNEWHRRQSYGLDRWRVNALWRWNGGWWAGDYRTGRIYQLDWAFQLEGCDVLERSRTMAVMHAEGNRVAVNALRLEFDTGSVESTCTHLFEATPSSVALEGDECIATSTTVALSGGTAPYGQPTVVSGSMPPEATAVVAGSTLTLSWGIGATPGDYAFTLQSIDAGGRAVQVAFTATIYADNPIVGSTVAIQPAAATALTLAVPAGAQAGDILVMAAKVPSNPAVLTLPVGFTSAHNGPSAYPQAIGYKAWAGETSVTITSDTSFRYAAVLLLVRASAVNAVANGTELTTSINKATNLTKLVVFAFDASRLADSVPPATYTFDVTAVGSYTKRAHSYWQNGGTNETNPQIQVFTLDCPGTAGTKLPAFSVANNTVDHVTILEFTP